MKKNLIIYIIVFITGVLSGAAGYYIFSSNSPETSHAHDTEEQLYTCGMHPGIIESEPGNCPICGMKLTPIKGGINSASSSSGEKKIIYWRAPMNPNEVYDAPGKSNMGMDLVPVYEDEGASSGVVTVDGAVMQSMNVKIEHVNKRDMSSIIYTNGILSTDERTEYTVNTKVGGWIEKLYVNYTGQEVKKGQKMVDIYSPELVAAQQELLTARSYEKAVSASSNAEVFNSGNELVKNAMRKLELFDISENAIEKLIETKNVTKLMTIYAPIDGTVLTKKVNEGEKINAGTEITKIADLTNLWLKADVYESELNKIEIGSRAEISFTYKPDKVYKGKVSFIYPTVNPKTRTVQIRVDLANSSGELKPAMYGNVKITGREYGPKISVPETAVLRTGKKSLVILALGEGRFKPVEVRLGLYSEGYYQILQGIKDGDMIVTSAQFMLDSESSLRSAIKLFSSSNAEEHVNMNTDKTKDPEVEEQKIMNMDTSKDLEIDTHDTGDHQPSIVREGIIDLNAIDTNGDGKVFQDLMDWNVISDEAGRCPICEMKLNEVTIDEAKKNLKSNGFEYK